MCFSVIFLIKKNSLGRDDDNSVIKNRIQEPDLSLKCNSNQSLTLGQKFTWRKRLNVMHEEVVMKFLCDSCIRFDITVNR
jgi:hypothetical protein